MIYSYEVDALQEVLEKTLKKLMASGEWNVLKQKQSRFREEAKTSFFNLTFTAIPRFIEKTAIPEETERNKELQQIRPGFSIQGWSLERLVRAWWLLQWPAGDKEKYVAQIESLFRSAEMNEQVALYGSLPLLAYPEAFRKRTAEGLRTNIDQVFEAIALDNPYPLEYLEEAAWNQLVLKSFFMDIAINRIMGLDKRANQTLAHILSDYAHERWAAGRSVNPLLWRPVAPFIDENILPDIERLFESEKEAERKAAALASSQSTFQPAKELLKQNPILQTEVEANKIKWDNF